MFDGPRRYHVQSFDFATTTYTPRTSDDATNTPEVTTEKSISEKDNDAITK